MAFLRCARYRVPARPRARAPRSAPPGRPGARQPRRERVAGGRRGKFRAGRPSPREPSAGEGAARRAPRVQRPRRRAPRRRRPARGRRAASSGRRPVRRGSPLAATNSPASGAVRPRKGAARPCKRPFLRCAAGGSVSPTARHAARRIIEGAWTLSGALFFCGVIVGSVNPLRWARAHRDGTWFFFSRERPSLTDGLGRQTRIRPRGGGLAAGQLVTILKPFARVHPASHTYPTLQRRRASRLSTLETHITQVSRPAARVAQNEL